jgi:hypothetical protein
MRKVVEDGLSSFDINIENDEWIGEAYAKTEDGMPYVIVRIIDKYIEFDDETNGQILDFDEDENCLIIFNEEDEEIRLWPD